MAVKTLLRILQRPSSLVALENLKTPTPRARIKLRILLHHSEELAPSRLDRTLEGTHIEELEDEHRAVRVSPTLLQRRPTDVVHVHIVQSPEFLKQRILLAVDQHTLDVRPVAIARRIRDGAFFRGLTEERAETRRKTQNAQENKSVARSHDVSPP